MKKSLFAPILGALLVTTAACSGAADAPAGETTTAVEEAGSQLFADLGGEPEGPIFTVKKSDTLAVKGYDVVSYFVGDGVPVEGSEEFTVRYQGYDYRFASEDNANAFVEDPARYAPAYGGYCSWAIGANDGLAPGDPLVYKIVNDRLHLNFNENVADLWNEDIPGFIEAGDANYPTHSPDEHYMDGLDQ